MRRPGPPTTLTHEGFRHARGRPRSAVDLLKELSKVTATWTAPVVVRSYDSNDKGRRAYADETAVLAEHGYVPLTQSEQGGHVHAGRLIMTGGLSVFAGKRGTRSTGAMTVTFARQATSAAGATYTPPDEESLGPWKVKWSGVHGLGPGTKVELAVDRQGLVLSDGNGKPGLVLPFGAAEVTADGKTLWIADGTNPLLILEAQGFVMASAVVDAVLVRRSPSQPATAAAATEAPSTSADVMATIRQLTELRDAGILTADEYDSKKRELLARL